MQSEMFSRYKNDDYQNNLSSNRRLSKSSSGNNRILVLCVDRDNDVGSKLA